MLIFLLHSLFQLSACLINFIASLMQKNTTENLCVIVNCVVVAVIVALIPYTFSQSYSQVFNIYKAIARKASHKIHIIKKTVTAAAQLSQAYRQTLIHTILSNVSHVGEWWLQSFPFPSS